MCGEAKIVFSLFLLFFLIVFGTTCGNSMAGFKRKKYTGSSCMLFTRTGNIHMLKKMESFKGGEMRTLKSETV